MDDFVPGNRRVTAPAATPRPGLNLPPNPLKQKVDAIRPGDRVRADFYTHVDERRTTYTVEGEVVGSAAPATAKCLYVGTNCLRDMVGVPHVQLSHIVWHRPSPRIYANRTDIGKPRLYDVVIDRNNRMWTFGGEWWESYSKPATSTDGLRDEYGPLTLVSAAVL